VTAEHPDSAAAADEQLRRPRRPLTLQTRLMSTVIAVVALLLTAVAVTTSTILGGVLQQNLDARLAAATRAIQVFDPGFPIRPRTAYEALSHGHQPPGFLLLVRDSAGNWTGAVVAESGIAALTARQTKQVTDAADAGNSTVTVSPLGAYRIALATPGFDANILGVTGLPLSEVDGVIARMLTTIAVVTLAGLLLLAAAIAVVIRVGLRPLRAVADTATRVASLPMDQGMVSIAERVPAAEADERTEVGQVGAALNTLLEHVDASLRARARNEERMRSFVADASHELRTPLASIRGYSELSLRAIAQAAPAVAAQTTESSLERIQAQSLRMTALVEDLLLLARLDEGQELVYGTVDLTRLAVEAFGDARPAGAEHHWVLEVGAEPIVIAADGARLHQVVANLLANARTHTPKGTTITLVLARDGDDAVLTVHDDGPGIDPAVADELFERFARADRSRARQTGGTGLGLSIVKAIVDAHHGTIAVASSPGDTAFTVRLHARPVDPVPAGSAESDTQPQDQTPAAVQ